MRREHLRNIWVSARERRLVRRASGGDVEAFRRLVDEHSELVRRVARRVLGREDVQDACQEVWMRAWQSIGGFRGESAFGTWLYRITVNTCLTHRGRESRREEREGGQDETPPRLEPAGGDADPETAALGAERREEVRVALQGLRREHRVALVLRHMQGLSYAEIAEALGIPGGTAKGWVSRGRAELLLALGPEYAASVKIVRAHRQKRGA